MHDLKKTYLYNSCFFIPFTIILVFSSCKTELGNPIPLKQPDMSQGTYDNYLGLLEDSYATDNPLDAALQLANLKGDKQVTYQYLNTAIEKDPEHCDQIYEWYWLYDRHNFGMNILKLDTVLFKKSVTICNNIKGKDAYQKFAAYKDQEEADAIANKEKEDSTHYNLDLVKELEQINIDDQDVRNRLLAKTVTAEQKPILKKEMNEMDAINMEKIDRIFKKYGYPSRDLVGKDCNFTPALVIHHSNSLATRYKYLPLLEKAVTDGILYQGTLDMIKRRIKDMELAQSDDGS